MQQKFCFLTTAESRAKIGNSKMQLDLPASTGGGGGGGGVLSFFLHAWALNLSQEGR